MKKLHYIILYSHEFKCGLKYLIFEPAVILFVSNASLYFTITVYNSFTRKINLHFLCGRIKALESKTAAVTKLNYCQRQLFRLKEFTLSFGNLPAKNSLDVFCHRTSQPYSSLIACGSSPIWTLYAQVAWSTLSYKSTSRSFAKTHLLAYHFNQLVRGSKLKLRY